MKKTVNLQLNLPENGDFFNVEHGNQNAVTLDGAVAGLQSGMAGQDQVISEMKTEISGKADQAALAEHTAKASAHVSDAERVKWNKAPVDLTSHTGNTTAHITDAERTKWNGKQDKMTVDSALSTTSLNSVQNKVVTAKVNEINSNLSGVSQNLNGTVFIREGSGADTKYYIQTGADAASKKELGRAGAMVFRSNVNMSAYCPEYKQLTSADFVCGCTQANMTFGGSGGGWDYGLPPETSTGPSYSYTAATGALTVSNGSISRSDGKDNQLYHTTLGAFVVWLGTVGGK